VLRDFGRPQIRALKSARESDIGDAKLFDMYLDHALVAHRVEYIRASFWKIMSACQILCRTNTLNALSASISTYQQY